METDVAIGWGILVGVGLAVLLYGVIRCSMWFSDIGYRVTKLEVKLEKDVGSIKVAITNMVQNLKGKQNDNREMVGAKPARPEKTS